MVNSRNINDLRPDVAYNCRQLISICASQNLPVLITGTYRDAEYQKYCYVNGTSATPELGPHGYRLAFDICKNIKGHEYDDIGFFERVAQIAKEMGFSWGGDWKSFKDRPHFEWMGQPPLNRNLVGKGLVVPAMPAYGEAPKVDEVPEWAKEAVDWATKCSLTDGTNINQEITLARMLTILYRYDKRGDTK